MGLIRKSLILAALLLLALTASAAAAEEFHLHDVLTEPGHRDCSLSVNTLIQQHVQAAVMAGVNKTGTPRIHLGEGCYRLDGPVNVNRTDDPNAGYSLDFVGAGVDTTIFRTSTSWVSLQFKELSSGTVSGFSVEGPGKTAHRGIVFGSNHVDLGSCCFVVQDVTVRGFNRCFQFGQDYAPFGAAADIVVISASAINCGTGFAHTGYNTIGIEYHHTSVGDSNYGWHNKIGPNQGYAQQISIYSGGAYKVGTLGYFEGNTTTTVQNFRDELRGSMGPRFVVSSGGGGHFALSQYTSNAFDENGNPIAPPVSIRSHGGIGMWLLGNTLAGQVEILGLQNGTAGSIDASGNRIHTSQASPWKVPAGTRIRSFANCKQDLVFGQCQTYWP